MKKTIKNEKDAITLITALIAKEIGDDVEIEFASWPTIKLDLKGDDYDSSINPSLMEGLIKVQQGVNRSYAKIVHSQPDARHLKDEEKQQLEFMAKVSQGSSKIEVDLSGFAQKLIRDLVGRTTPLNAALYSVVGAALWASTTMAKSYIAEQAEKSESADAAPDQLGLSPEEAENRKILQRAIQRRPDLQQIREDAKEANVALLRGCAGATTVLFNGIKLKQEQTRAILRSTRAESVEQQINGNYRILGVDTSKPDEIRIKVRYLENEREFFAKFRDDSLNREHVAALQKAEWSKTQVYLSVNARVVRGEVTTATIVSATQQPLPRA